MQGAGNDFVVLDCTAGQFELSRNQLKRIADRHFGVGCDQILVVEKPRHGEADFGYRIFQVTDGGEVEQCGNGARCSQSSCMRAASPTEASSQRPSAA